MKPDEAGRPGYYFDPDVVREYDRRYRGGLGRWKHARKLKHLRRWLANSSRALEVACGPGRWRVAFADLDAIHCDLSAAMLEHFHGLAPEAALVRADAARLPFDDASFDTVVSIRFVSHLRGDFRRTVLRELARVSRHRVIIDARHVYNLRYWSRWLRYRLGLAHAAKLRHTIDELAAELREAGLELRERRSVAWGVSGRVLLLAEKTAPSQA